MDNMDTHVLKNDHQMECLRAKFLATGRDSRQSLSPLVVNNKLIYQLHLLKEEGNISSDQVQRSFCQLFPESACIATRFRRYVERVAEKADKMPETDLAAFLMTKVDFDFLSTSLDAQGVTKRMDFATFKRCSVTNRMVVDLLKFCKKENYSGKFFHKIVSNLSLQQDLYIATASSEKELLKRANSVEVQTSYREEDAKEENSVVFYDNDNNMDFKHRCTRLRL